MKGKTIENNKPHPQSVSNSYSTKQYNYHHQQQQQHQQKILVAPSQQSKIPTVQNFNQISKTATNLLNDIYEKHLLNQTKFENVNIMNLYGMTTAASVENNFTRGVRRNGIGGNCSMKNLNVEINPNQHQQLINQKIVLSESVKNQQQFYQSVDPSNLSDYNKPNLNFRQGAVKISNKSRRIDGADDTINHQQKFIRNFNENETVEVMKQIKEHNIMQRTNEISYFHQNYNNNENLNSCLYTVKEDCPQQNIPKRRATPIGGDLCEQESVKFEYRNSKINLMLETAQAMAAAAYFARLVIFN